MGKRDKNIDKYVSKSKPFAHPILKYLRGIVHEGCPEVEETIKWSFPNFIYKGGILCNMASFQEHCTFGFWKASSLIETGMLKPPVENAMGNFGRIHKISDLPSKNKLIKLIKEAAKLNEEKSKSPVKKKAKLKKVISVPDYFQITLNKNKKAKKTFDNFSYSHKNEYIEWITEAKTDKTRDKRIATSIEWLSEGKPRNWKYMKN